VKKFGPILAMLGVLAAVYLQAVILLRLSQIAARELNFFTPGSIWAAYQPGCSLAVGRSGMVSMEPEGRASPGSLDLPGDRLCA
jgi:hypothetical protein